MKFAIDFDETITMVNPEVIEKMKKLQDAGHEVFVFTGRPEKLREKTQKILEKNGLNNILILMEKPSFNFIVDDDSLTVKSFLAWEEEI